MNKPVLIETSARHVHVTQEHLEILFGEGYELTKKKDLSQPDQFACEERIAVIGPKSSFPAVSILGPVRPATQVELSAGDARSIGVAAPIRESGDVAGSGACKLVGPKGEVEISEGVIVAKRHIHATPEDAEKYGITEDDVLASEEFGPTVGRDLRANATKSILIAALCMLIYIRFRFKNWQYGLAAVAGLAHDVLVALSLYAIFRITINNPFIAGILTVVGYSINDTIVVFDRIRENSKFFKRKQGAQLIDTSINQTLSRSLMTSLTTLLVMIPLFIMASSELRSFLIPLMIGVFTGTYSSIFLCSPVFYELTKKDGISRYEDNKAKADKQRKKSAKRREDEGIKL